MNAIKKFFSTEPHDDGYPRLIDHLVDEGVAARHSTVVSAMRRVDRSQFLAEESRARAAVDMPLAIPGGQTNSQPTTVAIMLRELAAQRGEHVLDVGFGSGWTTALLGVMVGDKGGVWGIETNPEAFAFGTINIAQFSQKNNIHHIHLMQGDGKQGWITAAPFNRILVSAAADTVPEALVNQLALGGRMVIPVRDGYSESLRVIEKDQKNRIHAKDIPGFRFVPLL